MKFTDLKDRKEKRKSNISKNEYFRNLINRAINNQVKFDYAVADNWFSSKENMNYIHAKLNKLFILGIKSNRIVACSLDDKINRNYQPVKSLDLKDSEAIDVYLQGINFPVRLMKKIFTNEDGSTGHLYLITNDLETDGDGLYKIYQKRWKIEEYHKSIKQNASLAKSPTKTVRSQCNHIFASIVAFCKLETLSVKVQLNHFALKYKLLVRSNQIAFEELRCRTLDLI
ncbi:transposase [Piscirickettsia salmonis]|nr:transposase [Piscirickettsia salmonis]